MSSKIDYILVREWVKATDAISEKYRMSRGVVSSIRSDKWNCQLIDSKWQDSLPNDFDRQLPKRAIDCVELERK